MKCIFFKYINKYIASIACVLLMFAVFLILLKHALYYSYQNMKCISCC